MKKKMILSIAFLISLLPMLFNQYGGLKGVQEITGLINLLNPIGMVSVILFVLGVWFPFKKRGISKGLGALGTIGIVVSEIYKFLTCQSQNKPSPLPKKWSILCKTRGMLIECYSVN